MLYLIREPGEAFGSHLISAEASRCRSKSNVTSVVRSTEFPMTGLASGSSVANAAPTSMFPTMAGTGMTTTSLAVAREEPEVQVVVPAVNPRMTV